MKKIIQALLLVVSPFVLDAQTPTNFIGEAKLQQYVSRFNEMDDELYVQHIPNSQAEEFLRNNIPQLDSPDKQLEETYYFRWWTYRKHIKNTPAGLVVTEFLPDVYWSGKYNTISCGAPHHFYEGRWLRDPEILASYAKFWFTGGGSPRSYSFWVADAFYQYSLLHPNEALTKTMFPHLKENFAMWEKEKRDSTQLFWQIDDRDGMELSVSGKLAGGAKGYRATINSYMYAESKALSRLAASLGETKENQHYAGKAEGIKQLINEKLWDKDAGFYKVIPMNGKGEFSPVRELHGYTPWYFNIPPSEYATAWAELMDTEGFLAPYGPTTVEQRYPDFSISYKGHECQWNGPSWPFSTSVTLTGLANLLNNYTQQSVSRKDYLTTLKTYSKSHQMIKEDGTIVPWIGENINPYTGDWISRTRLMSWENGTWSDKKGGVERGKDYNHSTFCDLVINGLLGVRPQEGNKLIVNPLLPENSWEYFCLENVPYKGRLITLVYDKTGERYNQGKGFMLFVDGKLLKTVDKPEKIEIELM